jgi:phage FluMu protein Com
MENKILEANKAYWETYDIKCPKCKETGKLYGHTELGGSGNINNDGKQDIFLVFISETFECPNCQLSLNDYNSLLKNNIELIFRSDDDVRLWKKQYPDSVAKYIKNVEQFDYWFENIFHKSELKRYAKKIMSEKLKSRLTRQKVIAVPIEFELVSKKNSIVGDVLYFKHGESVPQDKFALISEKVWLIEKANYKKRFIVFGNDLRVPQSWLERYVMY